MRRDSRSGALQALPRGERRDSNPRPPGPQRKQMGVLLNADEHYRRDLSALQLLLVALNLDPA